ncbi:MAG: aminodeoxychorismate/anthranilate synthase component II [Rhodospirillaceae bacterium]|nr:aminodeoxychorismate/anthranilate synthase component II [Rhodospirillaceae bacterium]
MFLLIDNYDSFTYNLLHFLGELGGDVVVKRNDAITPDEVMAMNPEGIVISPGPCDPPQAGICLDLLAAIPETMPVFGVCLGHQSIGQHFGADIVRAPKPMHGKVDKITHNAQGVFKDIPSPIEATRYHSLTIDPESFPDCLEITATSDDGVIQGLRHKARPIFGVQFHPESIASQHGHDILKNFLDISKSRKAAA